jgi:hypothetical protein
MKKIMKNTLIIMCLLLASFAVKSQTITTVAGDGTFGYSGDGGSATLATIHTPRATATDGKGNIYIADLFNHRIRKIDTNGIITTIVGGTTAGYSGDGVPPPQQPSRV